MLQVVRILSSLIFVLISSLGKGQAIGESYGGGKIFYIDGTTVYISSTRDQDAAIWGCYGTSITETSTAIGTGKANNAAIMSGCATEATASRVCNELRLNGYEDWYLPSSDEFYQLCLQRGVIGNFHTSYDNLSVYWTSSQSIEFPYTNSYVYFMNDNKRYYPVKYEPYAFRCIRSQTYTYIPVPFMSNPFFGPPF